MVEGGNRTPALIFAGGTCHGCYNSTSNCNCKFLCVICTPFCQCNFLRAANHAVRRCPWPLVLLPVPLSVEEQWYVNCVVGEDTKIEDSGITQHEIVAVFKKHGGFSYLYYVIFVPRYFILCISPFCLKPL